MTIVFKEATDNWLVYRVAIIETSADINDWQRVKAPKDLYLNIPIPDINASVSTGSIQLWKKLRMKLDEQMLNMLIIRDIQGNLSVETLREFAVGYALRAYSVRGKLQKNLHITYEKIDMHIMLAKLLTTTMKAGIESNMAMVRLHEIPVIKSVIATFANIMVEMLSSALRISLSDVKGIDLVNLVNEYLRSNINFVEDWHYDDETFEN
jgi:hypothetical protein